MMGVISELASHHDRENFDCGVPVLNQFLQRLARQQAAKNFNRTYVATASESPQILGYYVISSGSMDFQNWSKNVTLPRYPVPIARIGRLAVATAAQGQGMGAGLLRHAMGLSAELATKIGLHAVVVDAKDEQAARFYARHGFVGLPDTPLTMVITTAHIQRALAPRVTAL